MASFPDGLAALARVMAAPGAEPRLKTGASVLGMSYHNAGVEHERLGRVAEAGVSYARCVGLSGRLDHF